MSLMAELIGEFDLTSKVERGIAEPSDLWKKRSRPRSAFCYDHRDGVLAMSANRVEDAAADGRLPGEPVIDRVSIFFHLNTPRALEGGTVALECVLRVMALVDENLAFFTNDYVKLARRNSTLTLFRLVPENDFWDIPGRLELVPEPYEWVKLPTPEWYPLPKR
ncbi:MAG: hypothetical protein AAF219_07460 [Myxococcota bacterium]